jgi:hypothetical protein
MNTYNIVLLIRSLFFLGMIGLLVVAGALIARRDRRRAATPAPVAPTKPGQQSGSAQRRHRGRSGQVEADDSDASALAIQRRAA